MENIKFIVTDLDGTFLTSDKIISDVNLKAVSELKNKDIAFTIATGRMGLMVKAYKNELDINVPYITCGGSVIYNSDGTILKKITLNTNSSIKILDFAKENNIEYLVYLQEDVYFTRDSIRRKQFERYNEIAKLRGEELIKFNYIDNNHSELVDGGIIKILAVSKTENDLERLKAFIDTLDDVYYVMSEKIAMDILPVEATKGNATITIAEHLGIKNDEILVFGDYFNDISMFDITKNSVAMKNALDDVKKHANMITKSNDEDGVAYIINKYILGDKE